MHTHTNARLTALGRQRLVPHHIDKHVPLAEQQQVVSFLADTEHGHQQKLQFQVKDTAAVAAIRNGLEEADQIGISPEINSRSCGLEHRGEAGPASKQVVTEAQRATCTAFKSAP
jgi:hypothetical protein